ncbi:hypothetical protein [Streptomyces sp. HD]|uniref:hypothetical protein n=1 Tax=Streptomyces sp. HD TaxID=3020892 RepID=UPI00232F29AC|nr:hypothetical protein [Streptomyces sp. HD]MDC0771739.1 hypothetical protein [Streptomyces sp. HD]
MRRAVIPVLITSCAALLSGCSSGEIDAKSDTPHTAASEAGFTPTPPPSAEPFPGTGALVKKSVGNAAKHADRSGFSLDFMTYAHGNWAAGYEINIYTYNEDHKVSSVTDLSSIARHKDTLVCRAKKIGPKSYAIYFDDTYDLCLRKGISKSTPPPTDSPEPTPTNTPPKSTPTYAPPKPAGCTPKSPAGNCYQAGQYCPKVLAGTSGTNSSGTVIYCRLDSTDNRWHWRY